MDHPLAVLSRRDTSHHKLKSLLRMWVPLILHKLYVILSTQEPCG